MNSSAIQFSSQKPQQLSHTTSTTSAMTATTDISLAEGKAFEDFVKKCADISFPKEISSSEKAKLIEHFVERLCNAFSSNMDRVPLFKDHNQRLELEKHDGQISFVGYAIGNALDKQLLPARSVLCTVHIAEFKSAIKAIFQNSPKIMQSYHAALIADGVATSKTLLILASAVLDNREKFSSKIVAHATEYFLKMAFPISNFDRYVELSIIRSQSLTDFVTSGTLPPGDEEPLELLQTFFDLMFPKKTSSISKHDHAELYCAFIIQHIKSLSLMNLKANSLIRGLGSLLGMHFKGVEIVNPKAHGIAWDYGNIFNLSLQFNPNLTTIRIDFPMAFCSLIKFSQTLANNSTVRTLAVNFPELDLDKFKSLISFLTTNTTLKQLSLCYEWGMDAAIDELVARLKKNTSLEELTLCGKPTKTRETGQLCITGLIDYFKHNPSLKVLRFDKFDFLNGEIKALLVAVKINTHLERLDLDIYNCAKTDQDELGNLLAENRSLRVFNICVQRPITPEGIITIAENLHHNSTLQHLSLHGLGTNLMKQPEAITQFVDAVVAHPCLKTLTFSCQYPDYVSSMSFTLKNVIKLIEKSTLTGLKIGQVVLKNGIELSRLAPIEYRQLLNALEKNQTLLSFDVRVWEGKIESRDIKRYMERNRQLLLSKCAGAMNLLKHSEVGQNMPTEVYRLILNRMGGLYLDEPREI